MSLVALLIVSWGFGTVAARAVADAAPIERAAFGMLLGLCISAVLIIAAGSWSLAGLHIAMMALAVPCAALLIRDALRGSRLFCPRACLAWPFIEKAAGAAVLAGLALGFVSALAPCTGWDAASAHMALPAEYQRRGFILAYAGNTYSGYPHLLHSLYTYAYYGSGEQGVQALNWLLSALTCAVLYALGNRLGGRRCGLFTAAMFAVAPIFHDQTGTASLDAATSGVIAAALACALAWGETGHMGWLLLGASFAGSACGMRHTGYLAAGLIAAGLPLLRRERASRAILMFSLLAAASAAPWLLRGAYAIGNPLYPFFQGIFPSSILRNIDVTALGSHESLRGSTLWDMPVFLWEIVMRPGAFDGWRNSPGPFIIALGLPGVLLGGRPVRWLAGFVLLGVTAFFFFQHYARYLLPFMMPLFAVAAYGACRLDGLKRLVNVLLFFGLAYGLCVGFAMAHFKFPVAFGFESRQAYLEQRVERYPSFEWVNEHLAGKGVILMMDPRQYYVHGPAFVNIDALLPLRALPVEEQARRLAQWGITHVYIPWSYVEKSPRFGELGFRAQFYEWIQHPELFQEIKQFDLERRSGVGKEHVAIYALHAPEDSLPSEVLEP